MKPRIVLSGVNFTEGGPLAIFQDALHSLVKHAQDRYEIVALVHKKNLFDAPGVTFQEYPDIRRSWLRRLRFEYWDLRSISKSLGAHLWLSMHDMTPRVTATIRAVYCHNPAPFYQLRARELLLDPTFTLFVFFYRYLYGIGIRHNDFVVVQQSWIRDAFEQRYSVKNVVVAHPSVKHLPLPKSSLAPGSERSSRFFFPALPRSFKNIELLLGAAEELERRGSKPFELRLTISGNENRYARRLFARYEHLKSVRWLGLLTRGQVMTEYAETDCLLFPSRLETWGMPLSEFKETGKTIFAADLPYAHETLGTYAMAHFIQPDDPSALADAMSEFMTQSLATEGSVSQTIAPPYAEGWAALFCVLLGETYPNEEKMPL